MDENVTTKEEINFQSFCFKSKKAIYGIFAVCFFILIYIFFLSPPGAFPVGAVIKIEPGMGLHQISYELKKENIIKSRVIFESLSMIFGKETKIQSADYFFEKKLPVWSVAYRISKGKHNMDTISITIPEGLNIKEIGEIFSSKLPNFNKQDFMDETLDLEGYLFPDTYFFFEGAEEGEVVKVMTENFKRKIESLSNEIISSQKTKEEIIIMASILEDEAKGDQDREMISGILWKRIKIGMPLQVDAWMETYKKKGLPEKPINNPGLLAIEASIHPKSSPYLYYLHDKDGNVHYAKNFTEHINNKNKYLK